MKGRELDFESFYLCYLHGEMGPLYLGPLIHFLIF